MALDRTTVRLLRAYLHRQRAEHEAAGQTWHESDYMFTTDNGRPLHPDWVTRRFPLPRRPIRAAAGAAARPAPRRGDPGPRGRFKNTLRERIERTQRMLG